jgi:hypothetical protein
MPNKLAIALQWNGKMTDDWSVCNCDNFCISFILALGNRIA